jgi:hypothetical protein
MRHREEFMFSIAKHYTGVVLGMVGMAGLYLLHFREVTLRFLPWDTLIS